MTNESLQASIDSLANAHGDARKIEDPITRQILRLVTRALVMILRDIADNRKRGTDG